MPGETQAQKQQKLQNQQKEKEENKDKWWYLLKELRSATYNMAQNGKKWKTPRWTCWNCQRHFPDARKMYAHIDERSCQAVDDPSIIVQPVSTQAKLPFAPVPKKSKA